MTRRLTGGLLVAVPRSLAERAVADSIPRPRARGAASGHWNGPGAAGGALGANLLAHEADVRGREEEAGGGDQAGDLRPDQQQALPQRQRIGEHAAHLAGEDQLAE